MCDYIDLNKKKVYTCIKPPSEILKSICSMLFFPKLDIHIPHLLINNKTWFNKNLK